MTDLPAVSVDNLPSDTALSEVLGNRDMGGGIAQTVRVPVAALANLLAPFGTHVVFATRADMDASLAYPANTGAEVWADSTSSNNGIYRKSGASGSGSWSKVANLALADVETRLTDFDDALTGEGASRVAGDLAGIASILNNVERPGEAPGLFANLTSGRPEALSGLPSDNVVAVSGRGRVYRVTGEVVVAARRIARLEPGRKYRLRGVVRRAVDPGDPAGDAVTLEVQVLDASGAASGGPVAAVTLSDLTVASGARAVEVVVSTVAAPDVDVVIPSGAYMRAYWHTQGTTCQTDVETLSHPLDVTDALAAKSDAAAMVMENIGRPGDRPDLFTGTLTGLPAVVPPLSPAGVVTVADGGRVYRVTGEGVVARRAVWRVEHGRLYQVRGTIRRAVNVAGTPSDAVTFNLWGLGASGASETGIAALGGATGLATGQRVTIQKIVSTVAGPGVDVVLPAGTIYVRPYWYMAAGTCTNDVELVSDLVDVTEWGVLTPDLTSLTSRVAGIESQQPYVVTQVLEAQAAAEDALAQAQAANAAPSIAYDTLAELQAVAADYEAGVVGFVNAGDDVGQYVRDASASGGWRLQSTATVPALDKRLVPIEAQRYYDDELPDQFVFLDLAGRAAGIINDNLEWDILLSTAALARVAEAIPQPQDPSLNSITFTAPLDDETKYKPLAHNDSGDALVCYTAEGKVWLDPDFETPPARTIIDDVTIFDRPPNRLDNYTRGYVSGAEWLDGKRLYVCASSTDDGVWRPAPWDSRPAGNAWSDGRMPLPGDAVLGARPVVAIGFARLIPGYTGAASQIRRPSDNATTDLALTPSGLPDFAALYAFLEGDDGVGEILHMDNQAGGDPIPWTGTRPPRIYVYPQVGNTYGVIIETDLNFPELVSSGFSIPYAFDSNSVSVVWCGSFHTARQDHPVIELSNTERALGFGYSGRNTGTRHSLACFYGSPPGATSPITGTWYSLGHTPSLNAMAAGYSSSSAALSVFGPDGKVQTFSALPSASFTGGLIGKITAGWFAAGGVARQGGTLMGGLLIYDVPLTDDEMHMVRRSFLANYQIQPQARATLIGCGDSIEQVGFTDAYFESITKKTARLLHLPVKPYLIAQSGGGVDSEREYWDEVKGSIIDPNAPVNIVTISVGTNNFGSASNNTFAYVYPKISAWVADAKGLGCIVVLCNIRPRNQWTAYPERGAEVALYNQWCRDNWEAIGVDVFIDYDDVPIIGATDAWQDETLYYDGTHLTPLGDSIEAQYRSMRINQFLATYLGV